MGNRKRRVGRYAGEDGKDLNVVDQMKETI
jgi:hypothetical protein